MLKKIYSLEEQYQLINIHPNNIQQILNLDREILKIAIKKKPNVVKFVSYPDDEIKFYTVRIKGQMIQFFKNPSPELRYSAINNEPYAMEYLTDLTEEEQLIAISNGKWFPNMSNPSLKVLQLAIKIDIGKVYWFRNLSLECQILSCKVCIHDLQSHLDNTCVCVKFDKHPDFQSYEKVIDNVSYIKELHQYYELFFKVCPGFCKKIDKLPGILQQLNHPDPPVFNFADFDVKLVY